MHRFLGRAAAISAGLATAGVIAGGSTTVGVAILANTTRLFKGGPGMSGLAALGVFMAVASGVAMPCSLVGIYAGTEVMGYILGTTKHRVAYGSLLMFSSFIGAGVGFFTAQSEPYCNYSENPRRWYLRWARIIGVGFVGSIACAIAIDALFHIHH